LSVPPFTRAFFKSPSSRGICAIAELLVSILIYFLVTASLLCCPAFEVTLSIG